VKLTVHEFLTLDGVMQGPGGPDEDTSDGFTAGGWGVPWFDDETGAIVDTWFARTGAVLLGRTTWEMMRPYWTQVTEEGNRVATVLNTLTKHVVTSSPLTPPWGDSRAITLEDVAKLTEQDGGELQVHGSWQLATALHGAGLVDEYRLIVFPVTVGAGKRLFDADAPPTGFTLVETRPTASGAVYSVLTPAPFATGEFVVTEGGSEAKA
jgi:dihydrofolate reductase